MVWSLREVLRRKLLNLEINCSSLKICAVRYFLCIDRDTKKKKIMDAATKYKSFIENNMVHRQFRHFHSLPIDDKSIFFSNYYNFCSLNNQNCTSWYFFCHLLDGIFQLSKLNLNFQNNLWRGLWLCMCG